LFDQDRSDANLLPTVIPVPGLWRSLSLALFGRNPAMILPISLRIFPPVLVAGCWLFCVKHSKPGLDKEDVIILSKVDHSDMDLIFGRPLQGSFA